MKIKYLSPEDRKNLHILRRTTDSREMISILRAILRRPFYTMQALWEYRKWFLMLTEDQLKEYPDLACGLVQILIIDGELDRAKALAESLPKDSVYQVKTKMMLPGIEEDEREHVLRRIREEQWGGKGLVLTGGRPSVVNGIWDMTAYHEAILQGNETLKDSLKLMYLDSWQQIYDIARAEIMYQQNDCYNALVLVVSTIPHLKEKQDMRILFAALALEMFILVLNGQASTSEALITNLQQQIREKELEAYLPNIDAMTAWAAMYDGDYAKIARWMRETAPDEHGRFCMLDLFRYMVKMRAYIIQGKYLAVTALAGRLLPLLEKGKRRKDLCELHLIWAMSDHAAGRTEEALEHMRKALELAEKYRYDRLVADEAQRMYILLKLYRKQFGKTPYLQSILEMTEKIAAIHPRYLKSQLPEMPALTETELRILRLVADCKTNAEIAEICDIAVETAKRHCKNILAKLEVKNRHQAVQKAIELGVLEPGVRG